MAGIQVSDMWYDVRILADIVYDSYKLVRSSLSKKVQQGILKK